MRNMPTAATAKGYRESQEDRYVVTHIEAEHGKGQLMALMDGHGGPSAADRVARSVEKSFIQALAESKGDVKQALYGVVEALAYMTQNEKSGTTLSIIYIPDDESRAHVAVIGDSPVIITDKNGKIRVSPEHNVRSNPGELDAARERGAIYSGGYIFDPTSRGGLQLSRALGDRELARVLSREPDVYSVELGKESIIVVASDGVFDPSHGDVSTEIAQAVDLVRGGGNAQALVDDAIMRMTGDNATAIVWRASMSSTKKAS
jgi:serine/threonine protein phosphatase PrpC